MTTHFDKPIDRRASDSTKWNKFDPDVLPLWVADMDFSAPDEILAVLRSRIDHGVFGYSSSQDGTLQAIQDWLSNRHGWNVSADDILLVPGVVQAFNAAAKAFSNPGDSVLIQTPAYHPFFHVAPNNSLRHRSSRLSTNPQGRYFIDPAQFQQDLTPDTRSFMLCNPHNPSGRVFTREELEPIAHACLENNTVICSDEIHSDLVFHPNRHLPVAAISDEIAANTVTFISASKTFNIAGLKSSAVIITNPRLRELYKKALSGLVGSVNLLGELAMAEAYRSCSPWLEELLVYLQDNRDLLVSFIDEELPFVNLHPPEGTYLAWLDFSNANLEDPAEFLLVNAKIGLNAGTWFGEEYKQFARMNFACPRTILEEALQRLKKGLEETC